MRLVQWWNSLIFASYGIAILIGSPICGWLADHTSNRILPYCVGLVILAAATLLFGAAHAAWVLLASRFLQGLSSAVVYTIGLALLVDTVGRDNVGQWMGTALSSSSFGLIISPLLGGIVYARIGYAAVFAMSVALIVIDVLMRGVMIEKKVAARFLLIKPVRSRASNDGGSGRYGTIPGQVGRARSSSDVRSIMSDGRMPSPRMNGYNGHVTSPPLPGPTSPHLSAHARPPIAHNNEAGNFPAQPSRVPPILRLLALPRVQAAIYAIFVNVAILAAFDNVLPVFVRETFGWDALAAGVLFLCLAVPALAGPMVGRLCDRVGPRWITVAGCVLTAPPMALLRLVHTDTLQQKILLCALLTACGCTLIMMVPPVATDLSMCVEAEERRAPGTFGPGGAYAQAFALFNCAMAAATLFGPVLAGWLRQTYGWGPMSAVLAVFAFSGAIPSVRPVLGVPLC